MFLGNGKSRRTNVNHLRGAFHPEHGLVWADGQHVNLSIISVNHDDVTAVPPTVLGQFDSVEQVAWSSDTTRCYLSVQHTTAVTVWKVDKCSQKLTFDKASEIQKRAIPQGCLWHPSKPLLVILCRDQLLLVDLEKPADQIQHINAYPRITAGIWSLDGSKVIVALGTDVCMYKLNERNQLVQDKTVRNFSGPIRALVPLTSDLVAMAHDLPLEQLLNQSQMDMFEATPKPLAEIQCNCSSEVKGHTGLSQSKSNGNGDQTLERDVLQKSGPIDLNALVRKRDRNKTCKSGSDQTRNETFESNRNDDVSDRLATEEPSAMTSNMAEPLQGSQLVDVMSAITGSDGVSLKTELNRPERSHETVDLQGLRRCDLTTERGNNGLRFKRAQQEQTTESSQLLIVDLGGNDTTCQVDAKKCILSSTDLPCVLNPDLVVYQRRGKFLVVGSNTQTKTYQVSVQDGRSLGGQRLIDLSLSQHERCLGLCTMPHTNDLLLLTGESRDIHNVTFLPSSSISDYQFKLRKVKLNYAIAACLEDSLGSESTHGDNNLDPALDFRPLTLPNGGLLAGTSAIQLSSSRIEEIPAKTLSKK